MRNVVITEAAESEIRLIDEYLAVFSASTADSFIDALESKIAMLAEGVVEFPMARDRDLASAGYRVMLVKSYLVLHKVVESGDVHIAHVFHQSQDYAKLVV